MYNYSVFSTPWDTYLNMIKTILIDSGVTSIGHYAFDGCRWLTSIIIPNSVNTIGKRTFSYCYELKSVIIVNSVAMIGSFAFWKSGLTSITIPNSVTIIEDYTFADCISLTSVTIPNSVTSIGSTAFYNCKHLTSVTIPNSVIAIGSFAFSDCINLTSAIIGDSVTTIGGYAFDGCTFLSSLIIGNSVSTIGDRSFRNCYFLSSLTLPGTIASIGYEAFSTCVGLNFITCEVTTPPIIDSTTFRYVPKTIPVYVPCNSYNAYKTADYWKNFTNFITIPDTLNTIFIFDTICYGKVYNGNGFNISDGAGTYYDTLQTIHGCDSVIICLTLSEYSIVPISYDTAVICQGDSYSFGKKDLTEEGIYYDTLQSINFCDSIICLNLSYYPTIPVSYDTVTIYQGNSYIFGGKELTIAGIYYDTLQNTNGCDSIVCLNLIVTNNITEIKTFNLTVYPNPTNSQLTINNEQLIINNVELFDIFGKCWLSLQSLLSPEPIIDISHLPNGIYILKINNLIINKIIKL